MRGLMKLGLLGLLVRGVRTFMKLGVVALAGYGVFQLYEQYAGDRLSGSEDFDRAPAVYDPAFSDSGRQVQAARDAAPAAFV